MGDKNAALSATSPGPKIAITGATGFVGRALLSALDSASVSALCRGDIARGKAIAPNVHWINGDLEDDAACAELLRGADVVIHLAGLTKALDRTRFFEINCDAARRIAEKAERARVGHFVLLSSLAATRPQVSDYAASKDAGEIAVADVLNRTHLSVIRAPAVLGPGDSATEPLFKMLASGFATAPGGSARDSVFSIVDVQDLARYLAELVLNPTDLPGPVAPYSVLEVGYVDLAETTHLITGRKTRLLPVPKPLIQGAGLIADLRARLTGRPDVFSSGKVREVYSGDWLANIAVTNPTPLETTLRSCLAPFVRAKAAS